MPEFMDRLLIWFFVACAVIGLPAVVVNDIRTGSLVGSRGFAERIRLAGLTHIILQALLIRWRLERRWRRRAGMGRLAMAESTIGTYGANEHTFVSGHSVWPGHHSLA